MADKKISELTAADALTGAELVEIVQGGVNKQSTTQDIADLGGGGAGDVRTVTGTGAISQDDNGGLVIFNSVTPFNFTLDQLTAESYVNFYNKGAGAVTFVNGTGVTLVGASVLPGAAGTNYPSALVVYETATTPRIVTGSDRLTSSSTDTSGGTITLDFELKTEKMFVGSASFATAKTIAHSNDTNALVVNMTFTLTNVAAVIEFPTSYTMEAADTRWDDTDHEFTPPATGKYEFSATFDGTDWKLKVAGPYA